MLIHLPSRAGTYIHMRARAPDPEKGAFASSPNERGSDQLMDQPYGSVAMACRAFAALDWIGARGGYSTPGVEAGAAMHCPSAER
jgi:hypothetical protein